MNKTPVTILTGFLGAGKTTLLNHILHENHGMKFAVIENEFGEVGVDDALIKKQKWDSAEEIIEMNNGCICCTVRGDLIRMVKDLLIVRKLVFDAIIIETTGLADPAPVAQTFFVDDEIKALTRLDGIITVIDCRHTPSKLDEVKPEGVENEAAEQVAFADRIILNKTDLISAEDLAALKKRLRQMNARAEIMESQYCRVEPSSLLNIKGFNLDAVLEMDPGFLDLDAEHKHDDRISSIGCTLPDPINIGQLQDWVSDLLKNKGNDLLRYKGIINVAGHDQKFVFQGVHMLFSGDFCEMWGQGEKRESRFCFIGKDLDRAELSEGFLACKAGELRFKVGDRVQANTGKFQTGTIIKLWDEGNPYRIRLDNGAEVWGPVDADEFVRALGKAGSPEARANYYRKKKGRR